MKPFKLDDHPQIESGFLTPENYFEDLSSKILIQLPRQNQTEVKSLFRRKKQWIFAAAAILLLALTIPIYINLQATNVAIDRKTIENYISYHNPISNDDIVNLMDENDIQQLNTDLNIESTSIENELAINKNLEYYLVN